MRIAIISDVHSNLQALMKSFEVIDGLNIDAVYCLGDIVGYGGNPNECVELVRGRTSKCVLGNHDLGAVDLGETRDFTPEGQTAAEWTHRNLTVKNLQYLSGFPYRDQSEFLTLVHANPAHPESWAYVTSLENAAPQFEHFTTPLCFIGHSHVPSVCGEDMETFSLKRGIRFLINVGSVGQPRDGNPQISFGVFDTETWSYENIRADYDVRSAANAIMNNGLPSFLAERLFGGR